MAYDPDEREFRSLKQGCVQVRRRRNRLLGLTGKAGDDQHQLAVQAKQVVEGIGLTKHP
ncbi:MAG: hypothetical protein ABI671_14835 [Burkholderiales bacterium]